jgi:allantoinase
MKRSSDFFLNWGGISGCQHGFGLLLSEAVARRPLALALPQLSDLLSGNVARRFRIDRRKGRLEEGYDADLTLIEIGAEHTLANAELLYRHRQGPYDGRKSTVRIARTVVRGRTVFSQGRIAPGPAPGHFIRPS